MSSLLQILGEILNAVFPASCFFFTTGQGAENFITCVLMGLKDHAPKHFPPFNLLQVSFWHSKPLAATQASPRKDMEVLHKNAQF